MERSIDEWKPRRKIPDARAYEQIVGTFKKNKSGITLSDVAAGTGLPLERVKTLVPLAADEYSARLEVTESGEILYSFPAGFRSRYRGAGPALKRFFSAFARFSAGAGKLLFKAWIMVMLLGYFLLFMLIALASLFISISASSSSNNRRGGRGGMQFSAGIFDLIIRLWFYSEIFGGGSARRYGSPWAGGRNAVNGNRASGGGRPLHRAIFSFVFGEEDPNRDRETLEKKAFVSYLRKRRGVVSLPELMTLTEQNPSQAEARITSLCAEFGGSPEVTDEGTVVYRFDEILLSGEKQNQDVSFTPGPPPPLLKKLKIFSSNPQKMNFWFGLINGVNLLFGSYFLYNTVNIGRIVDEAVLRGSGIYGMVYYFLDQMGLNALPIIRIGLGLTPLLFSALFWLIPALRSWLLKRENNGIRMDNFRGVFYSRLWAHPEGFRPADMRPEDKECRPGNLEAAQDMALKEMGAYSVPEVSRDEKQNEVFDFPELRREKDALEKYRLSIDPSRTAPGKTVFDSDA